MFTAFESLILLHVVIHRYDILVLNHCSVMQFQDIALGKYIILYDRPFEMHVRRTSE